MDNHIKNREKGLRIKLLNDKSDINSVIKIMNNNKDYDNINQKIDNLKFKHFNTINYMDNLKMKLIPLMNSIFACKNEISKDTLVNSKKYFNLNNIYSLYNDLKQLNFKKWK